jgi:glycine/D-amino acid oxidase-like deaminating enzyme
MIGETRVRGLWACNGFSGHGFKLAPAVGSMLAQQIAGVRMADAWETSVPKDFMGPYRQPLTLGQNTVFA